MKILMVTMAMNIGGAETHILELCRELVSSGDEVTLASFGGVYADEAAAFGVKQEILPLHTKRPGAVLRSYLGLGRIIREGNFDIVHAHARIPAFICGLLWNRIVLEGGYRFRFVTTAHLNFSMNPLWRRIARWGERVMAVSDDIADYLVREYGYPRDRIHTTINGIDTEKFSPSVSPAAVFAAHGLDPARRRIVTISRLDPDRSDPALRLLDIAPQIAERFPDADVLIVGGGSEEAVVRARAEAVNREAGRNLVTVTGPVSNINEYCAAADVMVGVSRSALEAMAAAKPVILAGGQGALGIFDETKTEPAVNTNFCCRGLPLADGDTLLRDISALLSADGETLCRMGEFNRAFVLERYTARRMAEDYRRMYEKTLASPAPFHLNKVPADVAVSGYYGFGNLGDESLLDIIASSLAGAIPGVKIAAFTKDARRDCRRTGLVSVSRFNLPAVTHEIRRARLLLSGGGSLLQDSTSRRSLKYYAGLLAWAERCGTKTAVYSNGIGPIRDPKNRAYAGKVLGNATYVSVRDPGSLRELSALGVEEGKAVLSADPAFLLGPASPERLNRLAGDLGLRPGTPEKPGNYFAVSLRPLGKLPKGAKAADLTEGDRALVRETAAAIVRLAEKYGLRPLILPMQKSQDTLISEAAAAEAEKAGVKAALLRPESAGDLIGLLEGAQFTVAMRLHAVIFASSAGTPVIALSYDPKVSSMMAALGQTTAEDLTPETLGSEGRLADRIAASADGILANRSAVCEDLARRAAEMRVRCREDIAAIRKLLE